MPRSTLEKLILLLFKIKKAHISKACKLIKKKALLNIPQCTGVSDKSRQANLTETGITKWCVEKKKVQMESALIGPSRAVCTRAVCVQTPLGLNHCTKRHSQMLISYLAGFKHQCVRTGIMFDWYYIIMLLIPNKHTIFAYCIPLSNAFSLTF